MPQNHTYYSKQPKKCNDKGNHPKNNSNINEDAQPKTELQTQYLPKMKEHKFFGNINATYSKPQSEKHFACIEEIIV